MRRKGKYRGRSDQRVPASVLARPIVEGRRTQVHIATDTSVLQGGTPHAPTELQRVTET
jgi:hypothetical protein